MPRSLRASREAAQPCTGVAAGPRIAVRGHVLDRRCAWRRTGSCPGRRMVRAVAEKRDRGGVGGGSDASFDLEGPYRLGAATDGEEWKRTAVSAKEARTHVPVEQEQCI